MLVTPEKIRTLQRKLYCKAKQEPVFRFYSLYDKVYRADILSHAYRLVRTNKGAPGIDGVSFESIEAGEGEAEFLRRLETELRERGYRSQPVRRVWLPKPDGSRRPLGIPTIRDRVVQMAVKLLIEPIFEADFCDSSYGFRPKRSAHDAAGAISKALLTGHRQVIDADLSKYFDTIPHAKLMAVLAERISDKRILALIKQWLKSPVVEQVDDKRSIIRGGKKNRLGTPQGGVISPLLANLYPHVEPSRRSVERVKATVKELTGRRRTPIPLALVIREVNQAVRGWSAYFHYGYSTKVLGQVKWFTEERIRKHLRTRYKVRSRSNGYSRFSTNFLYKKLGLYKIPTNAKWKPAHALQ